MTEAAFQKLYEATNKPLWAYIYKLVNDNALTDDIFQEAYLRLLHAEVSRLNDAQVKAYLFSTATNLLRDHWRKEKRERNWFEKEPATEIPGHQGFDIHLGYDVNDAFQTLSAQHRSLLWLAYVEEYEHKEIAHMLTLNEKSIKVLLFRAKKKLIEVLQRLGIEKEVNHE